MLLPAAEGSRCEAVLGIPPHTSRAWNQPTLVILVLGRGGTALACYGLRLGAGLVVPFAGLELLVIGLGYYLQCCHAHKRQVSKVGNDEISFSDNRKSAQQVRFPRAWLKIIHTHDPHGWYPSRLFIGSHGKFIEIGEYLIESERKMLANHLRCAIQGA